MGRDPQIAPIVGSAPRAGVEVEGGEVEGGDLQVGLEVEALAVREGVASVAAGGEPEALVAERHHVRRVERLDVRRDLGGPGREDRGGAPVAARLVGQLPREHGRRRRVPRHHGRDVRLVLRLRRRVRVPACRGAAEGRDVLRVHVSLGGGFPTACGFVFLALSGRALLGEPTVTASG